jgi:hypothetical protein
MSKSKVTSGGGNYKKPVVIEAKKVFGTKPFTLAIGSTMVSGYCTQIQTDLINSGDLELVTTSGIVELYEGSIMRYGISPKIVKFSDKNDLEVKRR